MDRSFLHKYTEGVEPPGSNVVDLELWDDLGAFGWLRGIRDRSLMLELRRKDGNVLALGCAWLHRIEFDASTGITLWFGSQKVLIRGRNLNAEVRPQVRLFEGLVRHRVPWIREVGEAESFANAKNTCVVEAIVW